MSYSTPCTLRDIFSAVCWTMFCRCVDIRNKCQYKLSLRLKCLSPVARLKGCLSSNSLLFWKRNYYQSPSRRNCLGTDTAPNTPNPVNDMSTHGYISECLSHFLPSEKTTIFIHTNNRSAIQFDRHYFPNPQTSVQFLRGFTNNFENDLQRCPGSSEHREERHYPGNPCLALLDSFPLLHEKLYTPLNIPSESRYLTPVSDQFLSEMRTFCQILEGDCPSKHWHLDKSARVCIRCIRRYAFVRWIWDVNTFLNPLQVRECPRLTVMGFYWLASFSVCEVYTFLHQDPLLFFLASRCSNECEAQNDQKRDAAAVFVVAWPRLKYVNQQSYQYILRKK
jgi:hypothetical protein